MKHPPLLFLDVETLGLQEDSPIWEIALLHVTAHGQMREKWTCFVKHDPRLMDPQLPDAFIEDYNKRFVGSRALDPIEAFDAVSHFAEGSHVCGSNPSFDMERIEKLDPARTMAWHYHPLDIPTLVHGYLLGKGVAPAPPWKSDYLSRIVGVDPADFDRHTAMGDCLWTFAMWEAVTP